MLKDQKMEQQHRYIVVIKDIHSEQNRSSRKYSPSRGQNYKPFVGLIMVETEPSTTSLVAIDMKC